MILKAFSGLYPHCDSINDFVIILFLLKFINGATRACALKLLFKTILEEVTFPEDWKK